MREFRPKLCPYCRAGFDASSDLFERLTPRGEDAPAGWRCQTCGGLWQEREDDVRLISSRDADKHYCDVELEPEHRFLCQDCGTPPDGRSFTGTHYDRVGGYSGTMNILWRCQLCGAFWSQDQKKTCLVSRHQAQREFPELNLNDKNQIIEPDNSVIHFDPNIFEQRNYLPELCIYCQAGKADHAERFESVAQTLDGSVSIERCKLCGVLWDIRPNWTRTVTDFDAAVMHPGIDLKAKNGLISR